MKTALVFDPTLAAYDLGEHHPLRPERVTGSVHLMEDLGLFEGHLQILSPRAATDAELERCHTRDYIAAVREAGLAGTPSPHTYGLGTTDTPVFHGMHEASGLVAGAGIVAAEAVASGEYARAFSVAGGLHHAHRGYASGFCVYNDVAVAMTSVLETDPSLRLAYVDIDAHHGDGVQEVFYGDPRVLTFSIHESGRYLFPGTGFPQERGVGAGLGTAFNLPMPPGATDTCYRIAIEKAVVPTLRDYAPDILVLQAGADAHHSDPLTSLGLTLAGYRWVIERIVRLAEELCDGRIVAFGGGGYSWEDIVPRAWTIVAATLCGASLPDGITQDDEEPLPAFAETRLLDKVEINIAELMASPSDARAP